MQQQFGDGFAWVQCVYALFFSLSLFCSFSAPLFLSLLCAHVHYNNIAAITAGFPTTTTSSALIDESKAVGGGSGGGNLVKRRAMGGLNYPFFLSPPFLLSPPLFLAKLEVARCKSTHYSTFALASSLSFNLPTHALSSIIFPFCPPPPSNKQRGATGRSARCHAHA